MTTQLTADDPVTADLHAPLTTKEGWRRFVDQNVAIGVDPMAECPAGIEDARLAYHSQLAVVATPAVQQITAAGRRLVVLNRQQLSARRGLIVNGAAGTGKTTAITQLGKSHELALRLRHGDRGPRLPVIYVTVPPAATPRMLVIEFARFLALPVTTRSNLTDVTEAVCAVLIDLGCDLVIVDELHNLNLATRSGAEVSDQLKYFAERLPATFVYAGIDVERVGLFSGTRGRQIASRFATIATKPFGYSTTQQRDQVVLPGRHARADAAAASPPFRHAGRPRRTSTRPHRRHDRQPVAPAARGRDRRHHQRRREDHQDQPGRRPARPRRRGAPRGKQSRPRPPSCPRSPGPSICRVIGSNGHRLLGRLDPTQLNGIPPMRTLPVRIPLIQGETHHSLARRLTRANHLTDWELFGALPRHKPHDLQNLEGLAQLTGHPRRLLERVVTPPGKNAFRMAVSACSHCLARLGITTAADITVPVWNPICRQHHRWLSRGHHADAEFDIRLLPEVTRARRRLAQMFVTPHSSRALQGWETAQHVLHRWTERGDWPVHRQRRLSHFIDTDNTFLNPQHPLAELVNFPEAVALARILNNPYWIAQATRDPSSFQHFHAEVRRRLDIEYEPYDAWDPLRIWRERDARRMSPQRPPIR